MKVLSMFLFLDHPMSRARIRAYGVYGVLLYQTCSCLRCEYVFDCGDTACRGEGYGDKFLYHGSFYVLL